MLEKKNYEVNSKINPGDGIINGQGCGEVSKMRYGLFPMSYNGCEMIAIYNFMLLEGYGKQNLADICLEMYPKSGVLFGVFGSDTFRLPRYFNARRIPIERFMKRDDFFERLAVARYGFLTFWNAKNPLKGIHTVCVENTGDAIRVYNRYNSKDYPYEYKTPDEVVDKCRFICGYCLKK
ncbi:MAG: hypothetical protein GX051_06845 [Clostridiales bacterium]|nr:hypothetical protein [Clostridiales bacterium]